MNITLHIFIFKSIHDISFILKHAHPPTHPHKHMKIRLFFILKLNKHTSKQTYIQKKTKENKKQKKIIVVIGIYLFDTLNYIN